MSLKEGKNERSPRFAALSRLEADILVCFFRHRARLPRRHVGRACTAACSRARAAGVVAEACETGQTSIMIVQCSFEGGVVKNSITYDNRYGLLGKSMICAVSIIH